MDGKATIFEFTSYTFEPEKNRAVFAYKTEFEGAEPIFFNETIILPGTIDVKSVPEELLKKLLEGLHLVLGISYYKFYCATELKVPYKLSKKEADFWNIIYKNGLGEFYFRNKLDPKKSPKFPFDKEIKNRTFDLEKTSKCLVAISGGKDSIVATELLKEQPACAGRGIDVTTFFTETVSAGNNDRKSDLVDNVAREAGLPFVKIERLLDPQVFNKHLYQGHIPISAIYAFLGIFYSILNKYSCFIVANEYSSNFGNIQYKGLTVNHQWSKSSEFENLFSDYLRNVISPDVKYFSLTRPFYEIRIAELFSKYKNYFPYFSSCNKNFRLLQEEHRGLWCGKCPKCAFTFILLSAFLKKEELLDIFKRNLYQDATLLPLFKDILGLGEMKPFDCVGTFEESKYAFAAASPKFKNDFIVKSLIAKVKVKKADKQELFRAQISPNIPSRFRFSGIKNVAILGYGKEGKTTKKYLQKKYPNLKIGILDEATDKNYLAKQVKFDLAVKTPGIKKELVKINYTTATNIFFAEIKKAGNTIVGITGSKGKSTTASLICSILKEAGKNVKFLGNIGKPMLETLLEPTEKDAIFVVELSSYQLSDIEFSPDIAVVTNLFPEHMDYHGGLKNYYDAKKNIIAFQKPGDTFIYNNKNTISKEWARGAKSQVLPFEDKSYLEGLSTPLLGEHNRENILASVAVAKKLGISDEAIKKAIEQFKPLPHRLEFVGEFKGVSFYDDAISTTPESTIMAIEALKNVDTIFLGGEDRGYDFSRLEKIIKKYNIRNAVVFPDSGTKIKLKGVKILKTRKMDEAVRFAYKNTMPGKICLLSCASPSYSLWKNFEEKGNEFKKSIKKFPKK